MKSSQNCPEKMQSHDGKGHSQLQQRPVRIGVAVLLVALLLQIRLERAHSLGIVPLKAIDDAGDVVGPLRRIFAVHFVGLGGCRFGDSRGRVTEGEVDVGDGGARSFRLWCRLLWAGSGLAIVPRRYSALRGTVRSRVLAYAFPSQRHRASRVSARPYSYGLKPPAESRVSVPVVTMAL